MLRLLMLASTLFLCGGEVFAAPTASTKATFELNIIHLNDFHAHFEQVAPGGGACRQEEEDTCVGGIARVVAKTKELLEAKPNSLLLNAGDNFQGTLWYTFHGWEVVAEFLNRLPWTAITLGNHEFDRKIAGVVPFIQNLTAPVVVANIDASKEPTFDGIIAKSYVKVVGFHKVGIIGVITSNTKDISSPEKLEFLPEAEAVAKEGARLKEEEEGLEIIVVLSHSGIEMDLKLAETDPYVDVIVGGHSHTLLYTGTPPGGQQPYDDYPIIVTQASGRKVAVVQAYCYTMYLGNLAAFFDEQGELISAEGTPIYLDKSVVPDPETVEAMVPWAEKLETLAKTPVGNSAVLLEQNGGVCAMGECNLGSFVADAMVHYFAGQGGDGAWTRAAIAITNSGGLRAPIPAGEVVYNDLASTLPFENTIDYLEVRGAGLRAALEKAVSSAWSRGRREIMSQASTSYFGFLQVSGIRMEYYEEATNGTNDTISERVRSIHVLCHKCDVPTYEPLQDDEWYPVAINNFLAGGGDGYYVFQEEGRNQETGEVDTVVVMDYLKKLNPVVQSRDGRIVFVENDPVPEKCKGEGVRFAAGSKSALTLAAFGLVSLGLLR